MVTLRDTATELANSSKLKQISPETIAAIIAILTGLFKMFQACKKPTFEIWRDIEKPSFFQRWKMRGVIKQHISDPSTRVLVTASILQKCKTIPYEDMYQLYMESVN